MGAVEPGSDIGKKATFVSVSRRGHIGEVHFYHGQRDSLFLAAGACVCVRMASLSNGAGGILSPRLCSKLFSCTRDLHGTRCLVNKANQIQVGLKVDTRALLLLGLGTGMGGAMN